jgi:hypothetical protein
MSGFAGDTLASALLANGVRLFGRSFKYHRPRGLLAAGYEEPNALVTVTTDGAREPNIRATELEIYDGLIAESQNRYPSLAFDVMAANQLAGKAFSAGFYYKTFMGPVIGPLKGTRVWMFCEQFIRRAAGLGSAGTTRRSGPLRTHERLLRRARRRFRPVRAGGRAQGGGGRQTGHPVRNNAAFGGTDQLVRRRFCAFAETLSPNCAPIRMSACSTARPSGAVLRRQHVRRIGARSDHKTKPATRRAAPPPLGDPRRPCRAGERRAGTQPCVSGQRPSGHHAGKRSAALRRRIRRPARQAHGHLHQQ